MSPLTQPTYGKQAPHFDQDSNGAWFQLQPHQQFIHPPTAAATARRSMGKSCLPARALTQGLVRAAGHKVRRTSTDCGHTSVRFSCTTAESASRSPEARVVWIFLSGQGGHQAVAHGVSHMPPAQEAVLRKQTAVRQYFRVEAACGQTGTEHKSKQKDAKLEEKHHRSRGIWQDQVLRGIVECRTK